ncbi:MAG: hypothetical protein EOO22_16430 [Comamonadaceae bacterium]|nr:MAG: hypothetical protein EOO22_16430 [Comamonadaceae bacterium]
MAKSEDQQRSDKGDNKLVVRWFIAAAVLIFIAAVVFNQLLRDGRDGPGAGRQPQEQTTTSPTPNPTANPTQDPGTGGTQKP